MGASPVTVVTVTTVPSPVTAVQTMTMIPTALTHSVAQSSSNMPSFPPVMVPPFRVPLPGMHIPLPGKESQAFVAPFRSYYYFSILVSLFYLPTARGIPMYPPFKL